MATSRRTFARRYVAVLAARRRSSEDGEVIPAETFNLVTEDGDPIVTEDGDNIVVEEGP